MEEINIKALWQATNQQLEKSLHISKQQTEEITRLKVHSLVSSMKPLKLFTILIGVLWVVIIGSAVVNLFLFAFSATSLFFLFSAAIQVMLTAIALLIYIYQFITIYQVDLTKPILDTQKKLANLQTTTLWVARILFLQLPVWTTFYWNESMLNSGNWLLWIIQCFITLSFAVLAVWLFVNIKFENRNDKWFRLIFGGKEWTPLMKSMELLEEIDACRDDRSVVKFPES